MTEKIVSGLDILRWQEAQPQGFHGILTNPNDEDGFLSKVRGATVWYKLGEGQDPMELMLVAKKLHDAINDLDTHGEDIVDLGKTARLLSQPKPAQS